MRIFPKPVVCKNKDQHSTDTGDGQTIIFTGADQKGLVSYHCSHSHCEDLNKEETRNLLRPFIAAETFILHQQNKQLNETDLFGHLHLLGCFYRRSEKMPFGSTYWRPAKEPMPIDLQKV